MTGLTCLKKHYSCLIQSKQGKILPYLQAQHNLGTFPLTLYLSSLGLSEGVQTSVAP